MTEQEENDAIKDLSESVNRACTKWLQGRGLKTGGWGEQRDAALERIARKDAERAAKGVKR